MNPPVGDSGIDDYIAAFSPEVRGRLEQLRNLIRTCLPGATETISYDMPTFQLGKTRVYFAGWKSHVAVYGLGRAKDFPVELQPYSSGKASLKFLLNRDLPLAALGAFILARQAAAGSEPNTRKPAGS